MTTKSKIKETAAASAFGPGGIVIAQSWDGGKTWKETAKGKMYRESKQAPRPRMFTRRIAAVVNEVTPSIERRIVIPFSALHEVGMLTGWATFAELIQEPDGVLDGLVLPGIDFTPEQVAQLRTKATAIMLDLDAPLVLDATQQDRLYQLIPLVDAVLVPTELLASRLRPYHSHVFVAPHTLNGELWKDFTRPVAPRLPYIRVAVPQQLTEPMGHAVAHLQDRFGDRARWTTFDWQQLSSEDERIFYPEQDVVIVAPPPERHQGSLAPLLPAMAAQCAIVADRHWTALRHGDTGYLVGRDTAINWTQTLARVMHDSRNRILVGRNARSAARRHTPYTKLNQLALPYRLLVPEQDPFTLA